MRQRSALLSLNQTQHRAHRDALILVIGRLGAPPALGVGGHYMNFPRTQDHILCLSQRSDWMIPAFQLSERRGGPWEGEPNGDPPHEPQQFSSPPKIILHLNDDKLRRSRVL